MVNLPGYPWAGHLHGQHDTVLTPTLIEPLQGDPGMNTPQLEAHRHGQVSPGTMGDFIHGNFSTWCQGLLQKYARGPTPHRQQTSCANQGRASVPSGILMAC